MKGKESRTTKNRMQSVTFCAMMKKTLEDKQIDKIMQRFISAL
jgi:hypothetical protein